jgi:hypothetical protein
MSPIELTMLGLGVVALVAFIIALCVLSNRVDDLQLVLDHDANRVSALANRVQASEDLLAKLVSDRVDDAVNSGCRSLNEVRS